MCVLLSNCLVKRKNACLFYYLSPFLKVAKYILKIAKFVARCFLERVARVVWKVAKSSNKTAKLVTLTNVTRGCELDFCSWKHGIVICELFITSCSYCFKLVPELLNEPKILCTYRTIWVNPISLSYPFPFPYPFVLPLALVPRNRVVSARGENTPLWNETPLGYGYVIVHRR